MINHRERWLTRLRWAVLPILMMALVLSMTSCVPVGVVVAVVSPGWGNWWVPTAVNIIIPIIINISF